MSDDPMNDPGGPTTPEHLDDDALSAYVDGEATPGEVAHLTACSTCRERADQFVTVGRRIHEGVPSQPPADADAAVAAALDATGLPSSGPSWPAAPEPSEAPTGGSDDDAGDASEASVVPLPKYRFGGRRGLVIAAAAAVLVAIVAVGAIAVSRHSSKETTAATAKGGSTSDGALGSSSGGAATPSTTVAGPTTTAFPRPPVIDASDLGNLSDPSALVAAVKDYVDNHRTPPPVAPRDFKTTFDITLCAEQTTRPGAKPQVLLLLATVTWKGTPAAVYVKQLADPANPTRTISVVALDGCADLQELTF